MDAEIGVVVAVAVFDGDVVADLEADAVAVVLAGFDAADGVAVAVPAGRSRRRSCRSGFRVGRIAV